MVQDAVLRNFEVIGEAAKRLDDAYRAAHPEIPWRALAGLWDVLTHQYEGVDLEKNEIWVDLSNASTRPRTIPPSPAWWNSRTARRWTCKTRYGSW